MDHHQQLKLELEQTAQRLERVKDKRRYREKKLAKLKEKLADAGITTDE
jgi:chaperonin cofactor prefoldin